MPLFLPQTFEEAIKNQPGKYYFYLIVFCFIWLKNQSITSNIRYNFSPCSATTKPMSDTMYDQSQILSWVKIK